TEDISEGKRKEISGFYRPTKPVSLMFRAFRPLLPKLYKVSAQCTGCGICVRVCPAKAICLKADGKPKFGGKCEVCQACLNACPQKAVTFARLKGNTRHYRHPDIKLTDLFTDGE
ncbi:MAG: 4Fe-4S binding protein, partial [Christensenellaceae bacterium]|nr:4Fe-4S binding protein [Christensenellaceae bacterium]